MKASKFEIKNNRYNDSGRYQISGRVYSNSNLSDRLDKWFTDNIFMLDFKCKTWNKLRNIVTKIESKSILEGLDMTSNKDASVKYSRKAGCSCGCSPGYVIKNEYRYSNRNLHVNMEYDITEFEKMIPKFDQLLKKEIEANNVSQVKE